MLTPRQKQAGVSLIEIMVGLVIAAMLLGLGIPSFSTFIQNSKTRNAAEAIQNGLNLARAEAVRRNTNVQFVLGTGSSWTVRCETAVDDDDGDGAPDCPGANPAATTPPSIQTRPAAEGSSGISVTTQEVSAADGTAAAAPVFAGTLTFNGLGQVRATTLPVGSKALFAITNPAGTCIAAGGQMRCLRVEVSSGGQIRTCDPALNQPDPQAC